MLSYALLAPWPADLADRFSRRWSMIAGLALFAVANLAAAAAPQLPFLVAAGHRRHRHRSRRPGNLGVDADIAPVASRGKAIGFGWRAAFAAIGIVSIISLALVALSLPRTERILNAQTPRSWIAEVFVSCNDTVLARALVTTFLFQAANLGAYTYLGTLLAHRFGFGGHRHPGGAGKCARRQSRRADRRSCAPSRLERRLTAAAVGASSPSPC